MIDINPHFVSQLSLKRPFVAGRIGRKHQHSVHSFYSLLQLKYHVLYVCSADFPSFFIIILFFI